MVCAAIAKKVRAILPFHRLSADQAHVSLVHQRGGLESVTRPFTPHVGSSHAAKLAIDQRN
jgi:hypothetical protein